MSRVAKAIFIIAILGIIASGYALYLHYQTGPSTFCNFSARFNCDIVNRSTYAEILGMPVAALGIVGYLVIAILSFRAHTSPMMRMLFRAVCIAGFAFSLYLTAIEAFVLATFCVVCLASQICILATTVMSFFVRIKEPDVI